MQQERKEKEEKRRRKKEETHGAEQTIQAGHRDPPLGLAGRGSARPTVCLFVFFFFPLWMI
jgi:hypothetical protein